MNVVRLRVMGTALVLALVAAAAITAVLPRKYAATARVLLPADAEIAPLASAAAARDISLSSRGGSRLVLLRHVSADPSLAASVVNDFVSANAKKPATVIDRANASRQPVEPDLGMNLLFGAAAGLLAGFG